MSNERKYQDHEVRQILDLAIGQDDAAAPALPAGGGLTLRELHEVGREVGLAPSRITDAVAAFEGRGEVLPRTTVLGLPTSVGSIVSLPRNPTDHEWERLIAELRTTFGVKGEVTTHGSLREWSHGTLHAFVEPTGTGYRLRLTDSRAAPLGVGIFAGGFLLAFSLLIFLVLLGKDDPGSRLLVPLFFAGGGTSIIALSTMALPGWAREQENRMEHICRYSSSLLAPPAPSNE
jgi:hypothetical protein